MYLHDLAFTLCWVAPAMEANVGFIRLNRSLLHVASDPQKVFKTQSHPQRPSTHKKGSKGGLGIHLRSAAPHHERCAPFHVTAMGANRHATPRRPAVRRGPTPIAAWDTAHQSSVERPAGSVGTGLYSHTVAQCASLVHPNALSIRLARRASPPSAWKLIGSALFLAAPL